MRYNHQRRGFHNCLSHTPVMAEQITKIFEESFQAMLEEILGTSVLDRRAAYMQFQEMPNAARKGFWVKMQQLCHIKTARLHDFFHNTWSKQFCDDVKQFRAQIQQIADEAEGATKEQKVQSAIEAVKRTWPDKSFHQQTLYQLVAYRIRTRKVDDDQRKIANKCAPWR